MEMINIKRYQPEAEKAWDSFIDQAHNSHFIFKRAYMEYHADRFNDYSLMIYEKQKLIALLPANHKDSSLYSHQGLTFAGLIYSYETKAIEVIEIFKALKIFLKENSFKTLVYKAIPHIYHQNLGEEDLYAITKLCKEGLARIIKTDIHSAIEINNHQGFSKGKKSSVKKAINSNLEIKQSEDFQKFFEIMNQLLKDKYDAKATHSLEEIIYLRNKFPENIKLFVAIHNNDILAGTIIYENYQTVKTQYIASTELGRELGAVDYLIDQLIKIFFTNKKYFDFGTSVAESECGFNPNLMMQKELFGARAISSQIFEIEV